MSEQYVAETGSVRRDRALTIVYAIIVVVATIVALGFATATNVDTPQNTVVALSFITVDIVVLLYAYHSWRERAKKQTKRVYEGSGLADRITRQEYEKLSKRED